MEKSTEPAEKRPDYLVNCIESFGVITATLVAFMAISLLADDTMASRIRNAIEFILQLLVTVGVLLFMRKKLPGKFDGDAHFDGVYRASVGAAVVMLAVAVTLPNLLLSDESLQNVLRVSGLVLGCVLLSRFYESVANSVEEEFD